MAKKKKPSDKKGDKKRSKAELSRAVQSNLDEIYNKIDEKYDGYKGGVRRAKKDFQEANAMSNTADVDRDQLMDYLEITNDANSIKKKQYPDNPGASSILEMKAFLNTAHKAGLETDDLQTIKKHNPKLYKKYGLDDAEPYVSKLGWFGYKYGGEVSQKNETGLASQGDFGNDYDPALNDNLMFDDDTGQYVNKDIIDAVKGQQKARRRHMKNLAADYGMTMGQFIEKFPDQATYQNKMQLKKAKDRGETGREMKYGGTTPDQQGGQNKMKKRLVAIAQRLMKKGMGKEQAIQKAQQLMQQGQQKQVQSSLPEFKGGGKVLNASGKFDSWGGYADAQTGGSGGAGGIGPGTMAQAGEMLGSTVNSIDAQNGKSDGGQAAASGLKGAGKGAAVGTMIAPGVGTAIGAGVGAIAGVATADKPSEQFTWSEADIKRNQRLKHEAKQAENAPTADGGSGATFFKHGGELDQHMLPEAKAGGDTKQLSRKSVKYKGQSHEEGGIKVDVNKDPKADIEVEGGEVQVSDKIYSDAIKLQDKNGKEKNKTIADKATEISKKLGEYQELAKNHPHDNEKQNTAKLMTKRLKKDLHKLFMIQEAKKQKGMVNESR